MDTLLRLACVLRTQAFGGEQQHKASQGAMQGLSIDDLFKSYISLPPPDNASRDTGVFVESHVTCESEGRGNFERSRQRLFLKRKGDVGSVMMPLR